MKHNVSLFTSLDLDAIIDRSSVSSSHPFFLINRLLFLIDLKSLKMWYPCLHVHIINNYGYTFGTDVGGGICRGLLNLSVFKSNTGPMARGY